MTQPEPTSPWSATTNTPGWDALFLALLVCAVLIINSFAEATLPNLVQDELRHPLLGALLPTQGAAAMGTPSPRPGDPLGLFLNAITLGLLLGYFVVDLGLNGRVRRRGKWLLLVGILLTSVFLPTGKLILLRQGSGPASYTHDGGVIQTEATIQFLFQGKNPYSENYDKTPMAEWGFNKFRTALYHYPYLPWTFLFSAPFYALGQAVGFYDQRLVYLLLMALALALAPRLVNHERGQLALMAGLGLNPQMALDLIFGQNDSFVLCWILFSLVAWRQHQRGKGPWWLSPLLFGLACASKPTAWFFAPFYGLLLIKDSMISTRLTWRNLAAILGQMFRQGWPALLVFALLLLPYVLWDPFAFYDDVWRWSNGQGETGYQIWGWGASNFVLAFGLVPDRFAQWPFWRIEVLLALPLLIWFLRRQQQVNTLGNACWHYGVFLLAFFYGSRFLNENYLGYILAFLLLGVLTSTVGVSPTSETIGSVERQ
jgi:hypothetical protein